MQGPWAICETGVVEGKEQAPAALRADLQATIARLTAFDKLLAEKSAALIGAPGKMAAE